MGVHVHTVERRLHMRWVKGKEKGEGDYRFLGFFGMGICCLTYMLSHMLCLSGLFYVTDMFITTNPPNPPQSIIFQHEILITY